MKLEDTALESIFTDLFDKCHDYYGEELLESGSGKQLDELPELNDEWLNKAEQCEKKSQNEEKRACQLYLINKQIADAEKLNNSYDPVYPVLPTKGPSYDPSPDANPISDDESSIKYGENGSISSADGVIGKAVSKSPEKKLFFENLESDGHHGISKMVV